MAHQPLMDPTERPSSDDDIATMREEQFLCAALSAARRPVVASRPGVCLNCGEQLANLAVYCDASCRDDHEHRLQAQRRKGIAG